jgi:hypothetical protein
MATATERLRSLSRRYRRWVVAVAILAIVYSLTGFLLFPWVLHRQLESRLATTLQRPVTIQAVRANPFALSVTIDGLLVKEPDGSPFVSWERLYFNARLIPILKRELALDALRLVRLRVHVALARDGTLNFSDILTSLSPPQPVVNTAVPPKPGTFVFGVDHLVIDDAQLDFSDLSRAHPFRTTIGPLSIHLDEFRTRPDARSPYGFSGTTEAGETFSWSGSIHIDPIRSTGTLVLDKIRLPKYSPYYEQSVGFELADGSARIEGSYELVWGPEQRVVRISSAALGVRSLLVRLRGAPAPVLELPQLDITGVNADLLEQSASVEAVTLQGGALRLRRAADGTLDVMAVATPPSAREISTPPAAPPAPTAAPLRKTHPYRWSIRRIALVDERIEWNDALPPRPAQLTLAPLNLELGNLSSERGAASTLTLTTGWNGKGQLHVKGGFSAWKPSAELAIYVAGLDLPSLDSYLALYGNLDARIGDGRLGVDGRLTLDLAPDPIAYGFEGEVTVDGFTLLDAQRGQELAHWKALQLAGIRVVSQPPSVSLKSVRWVEPRVKMQIAEDGSSNLRRILGPPAPPTASPVPGADVKSAPSSARAPTPFSIASFQIVRGSAGLVDRSVQPAVVFGVSDLDLRVRGLSNDPAARAHVEMEAKVGGAPFALSGTLSPRFKNDATDLKIASKGIDLTPLGPYFGKYVGYELEKGKLDLDLGYKVAARHVDAQNVVRIDQLTLGDETHSPDATKLPVKLGLAVLQDRDGVIELDVPVEGDVDDPDFRIGRAVWRAVGNVFTKIVTAPFAALGALFGGGSERLDIVDFTVGTAKVDARGDKTLQSLAKALYARPALRLEIEGTVDPSADGKVLRKQALRRRAQEAKWKSSGKHAAATSPDKVELLEDEYVKFIESEYRRTFSDQATAKGAAMGVGEMEEQLLGAVDLGPEAVRTLTQQRAAAARERILQAAQIDASRLFIVEGSERAKKEGGARVYFSLK